MSTNMLSQVLRSVAARMHADFQASTSIVHRGAAGTSRESIVRDFVSRYLPAHARAAHSAEIVTASGDVSPQCDVLIVDRGTPRFLDTQDHEIVPNECVYGVIEVKTKLDTRELTDACEKISKVKALGKTAYYPDQLGRTRQMHGRKYSYVPTVGMIFAFSSIGLPALTEEFGKWCAGRAFEERPDSIWVLGKGFIAWTREGKVNLGSEPGAGLVAFSSEQDVLLPLALQLNIHFTTAWMPPLRLTDYAESVEFGSVVHVISSKGPADLGETDVELEAGHITGETRELG